MLIELGFMIYMDRKIKMSNFMENSYHIHLNSVTPEMLKRTQTA